MSKIYSLLLFIVILSCSDTIAQTKKGSEKIKIQSISNVGLLNGSKGSSLALQTILGLQLKKTFSGVGVGVDYYRFRSIPLFIDLRQEFGKRNRIFFVYGDVGYNFSWLTDKNKKEISASSIANFDGGLYYDVGTGYKLGFRNSDALLFSLGYSFKEIKKYDLVRNFCIGGTCPEDYEKYRYLMSRWVIKAGWRF